MSFLYEEVLLAHYRNPKNYGKLDQGARSVKIHNPLCGDVIELFAYLDNHKITAIKFSGEGCVISQASASMLTEYAKGKRQEQLNNLDRTFMIKLVGINPTPSRLKCLMLPLEALQKILL